MQLQAGITDIQHIKLKKYINKKKNNKANLFGWIIASDYSLTAAMEHS